MLCGRTYGRSAVEATVSHYGQYSRFSAAGAERQHRFGCINVPLPRSVGLVANALAVGGPKPGWRCATPDTFRRVPGRQLRAT